jgi:hypothetical protein
MKTLKKWRGSRIAPAAGLRKRRSPGRVEKQRNVTSDELIGAAEEWK